MTTNSGKGKGRELDWSWEKPTGNSMPKPRGRKLPPELVLPVPSISLTGKDMSYRAYPDRVLKAMLQRPVTRTNSRYWLNDMSTEQKVANSRWFQKKQKEDAQKREKRMAVITEQRNAKKQSPRFLHNPPSSEPPPKQKMILNVADRKAGKTWVAATTASIDKTTSTLGLPPRPAPSTANAGPASRGYLATRSGGLAFQSSGKQSSGAIPQRSASAPASTAASDSLCASKIWKKLHFHDDDSDSSESEVEEEDDPSEVENFKPKAMRVQSSCTWSSQQRSTFTKDHVELLRL